MEPDKKLDDLCRGAYPPDGVPFAPVELLAERYARYLGQAVFAPMGALHIAAWAVATGVASERELHEALAAAKARTNNVLGRYEELGRLLKPIFARFHSVHLICVKVGAIKAEAPPDLTEQGRLLARQIAEAIGRPYPCCEVQQAADLVISGRMLERDLWGLVARARSFAPGGPDAAHAAFHAIFDWFLLGQRAARPATPPVAAPGFRLLDRLAPSAN